MAFPNTGSINDKETFQGKAVQCIKEPNVWAKATDVIDGSMLLSQSEYNDITPLSNFLYLISDGTNGCVNIGYIDNVLIYAVEHEGGIIIYRAIDGLPESTTFSRTSSAYHTQPDGSLVEVLPEELRIEGARRVDNLVSLVASASSEDWNTAVWLGGGTYANGIYTLPSFGGKSLFKYSVPACTAWVYIPDASHWSDPDAALRVTNAGGNAKDITPNTVNYGNGGWVSSYNNDANYFDVYLQNRTASAITCSAPIKIAVTTSSTFEGYLQITGDVESDIYNTSISGVIYSATENGNTVDENGVVTEAEGAALSGPFSSLQEPNTTNLISPNIANWVARDGTVAVTTAPHVFDVTLVGDLLVLLGTSPAIKSFHFWLDKKLLTGVLQIQNPYVGKSSRVDIDLDSLNAGWNYIDLRNHPACTEVNDFFGNTVSNFGFSFKNITGDFSVKNIQIEVGSVATSFTTGTRTADSPIEITLADLENENPQITYIDENDNIVTEDIFIFTDYPVELSSFTNGGLQVDHAYIDKGETVTRIIDNEGILHSSVAPVPAMRAIWAKSNTGVSQSAYLVNASPSAGISPNRLQTIAPTWKRFISIDAPHYTLFYSIDTRSTTVADILIKKPMSVEMHPLVTYDPNTDILSIGPDTTTTRRIIKVK